MQEANSRDGAAVYQAAVEGAGGMENERAPLVKSPVNRSQGAENGTLLEDIPRFEASKASMIF